ncbi:MAG: hypothetical protein ACRENP_18240 [Longimicrobiales bacterium]
MTESKTQLTERRDAPVADGQPLARVREDDLEPHGGLRYIARLFKVLAVFLGFLLIAEIVIGLTQEGVQAIGTLLVQATQILVFAAFLWGAGDIALMLIGSNHDLRAVRILLGRINANLQQQQTPPRVSDSSTPRRAVGP